MHLEALLDIRGPQIVGGYSKQPARGSAVSNPYEFSPKLESYMDYPTLPLHFIPLSTTKASLRHLEMMLFDTPGTGQRLVSRSNHLNHSIATPFDVLLQLINSIYRAAKLGIVHRDLLFGNVLVNPDNTLLLMDWECAEGHDLPPSKHVIGTVDTMAIALLPDPHEPSSSRWIPHARPWHNLETTAYLILKTIMLTFQPPADHAESWQTVLKNQLWDTTNVVNIRVMRERFWFTKANDLS
ncbi:hypothetical protein BKA62DRAFT_776582 [Auriculariales sp. MPI-PUGE-AT-0066]|nr:hypothetical protein BKA62DRAFT_776582 [Auriculariales sp. MPI-PUGE-AT-0066]